MSEFGKEHSSEISPVIPDTRSRLQELTLHVGQQQEPKPQRKLETLSRQVDGGSLLKSSNAIAYRFPGQDGWRYPALLERSELAVGEWFAYIDPKNVKGDRVEEAFVAFRNDLKAKGGIEDPPLYYGISHDGRILGMTELGPGSLSYTSIDSIVDRLDGGNVYLKALKGLQAKFADLAPHLVNTSGKYEGINKKRP